MDSQQKRVRGPAAAGRRIGYKRPNKPSEKKEECSGSSSNVISKACSDSSSNVSSRVETSENERPPNTSQGTERQICSKSLTDKHVCLESDTFSDTTFSENVSELDASMGEEEEESQAASSSVQSSSGSRRRKKGKSRFTRKAKWKKRMKKESEVPETHSDHTEAAGSPKESKEKHQTESKVESEDSKQDTKDEQKGIEGEKGEQASQEDDASSEDLTIVLENLKLLIPSNWVADIFAIPRPAIRLMCLSSALNAEVERCIYWLDGKVGIFVKNIPVPSDCPLLQVTPPEEGNIGSLADFLRNLIDRVSKGRICTGISEHKEMWVKSPLGFIEKQDCFRSKTCCLLLNSERGAEPTCQACRASLKKMSKEAAKAETEGESLLSVNDKYLTKEQLILKKNLYKTKSFAQERKNKKLERKVHDLEVKLDEVLRDELLSSLQKNQSKMTKLQKWFWKSQFDALQRTDKRGLRWHPMMVRIALMLESDPSTIRQFVQLPSKRRLYDYTHFIESKEGCQSEILIDFKLRIDQKGNEDHIPYVNVMFDEMHVRSGLVTSRSTGEVIGYTKLTELESELQALQDDLKNLTTKPKLAKKILVYYIHGITNDIEGVVAIYSSDDLSAAQLFIRTWDVIYNLEDVGIKVLCLTFDGASVNRKFVRMHASYDDTKDFVYCTRNVASGEERPLFFIVDPPHLLKTVRNNLANSFCHKKTRKLWKNNQFLSWKVIEAIHELTKLHRYRLHKLTQAHVKLTSFSCMKVNYAAQVCSNSVAQVIESFSSHEKLKYLDTTELVKLLKLMNRFFDCMNGKEKDGKTNKIDQAAYKSCDDQRIQFLRGDFLQFFNDWKQDVINRPGYYTEEQRSRLIISHQSLEALEVTVHGVTGAICFMLRLGAPAINARVFNQDRLEQYFSSLRQGQGDNRHPTLKSSMDSRLKIHVQRQATSSVKGNTEVEKRSIDIDDTPLPSRKKPRN